MSVETLNIEGVDWHVYYDVEECQDAYGTGDSPTMYEINLFHIEAGEDTQDIKDFLNDVLIEKIYTEILEIESEK